MVYYQTWEDARKGAAIQKGYFCLAIMDEDSYTQDVAAGAPLRAILNNGFDAITLGQPRLPILLLMNKKKSLVGVEGDESMHSSTDATSPSAALHDVEATFCKPISMDIVLAMIVQHCPRAESLLQQDAGSPRLRLHKGPFKKISSFIDLKGGEGPEAEGFVGGPKVLAVDDHEVCGMCCRGEVLDSDGAGFCLILLVLDFV